MVMVFNATFNTISVILWRSDLLVDKPEVPWEIRWQILSHNVVSKTPHHEQDSNPQL